MKLTLPEIRHGMIAGLAGTSAMSIVMAMKQMMGIVPGLNPIADLAELAHGLLGFPFLPLVGWVFHFSLGTIIWGSLFAAVRPAIPGSDVARGVLFGIGAWILMMTTFMPLTGKGLFGLDIASVVPMMTLMIHLIYGAVLGFTFGKISARRPNDRQ